MLYSIARNTIAAALLLPALQVQAFCSGPGPEDPCTTWETSIGPINENNPDKDDLKDSTITIGTNLTIKHQLYQADIRGREFPETVNIAIASTSAQPGDTSLARENNRFAAWIAVDIPLNTTVTWTVTEAPLTLTPTNLRGYNMPFIFDNKTTSLTLGTRYNIFFVTGNATTNGGPYRLVQRTAPVSTTSSAPSPTQTGSGKTGGVTVVSSVSVKGMAFVAIIVGLSGMFV